MAKVALVETKPSRTDFTKAFGGAFEFDQYQLCSDPTTVSYTHLTLPTKRIV